MSMINKKPEKKEHDECGESCGCKYMDSELFCEIRNSAIDESESYRDELLSGLKKVHEMGLVNGDWSDEQCDNFIKVLFKETQAIAKELGWDNE